MEFIPMSGMAGSNDNLMFTILKKSQVVFRTVHHFTLLRAVYEDSNFSTSSPTHYYYMFFLAHPS